jgi:hypothetical protein
MTGGHGGAEVLTSWRPGNRERERERGRERKRKAQTPDVPSKGMPPTI